MDTDYIYGIILILLMAGLAIFGIVLMVRGLKNGSFLTVIIGFEMLYAGGMTCGMMAEDFLGQPKENGADENSLPDVEETSEEDYAEMGDVENTELVY